MNINRSQELKTSEPGQYRVRETDDGWRVEGTDNNGVWVSCGLYDTRTEAEQSIPE